MVLEDASVVARTASSDDGHSEDDALGASKRTKLLADDEEGELQRRLQHRKTEADRRKRINDALRDLRRLTGTPSSTERSTVLMLAVRLIEKQQAQIDLLEQRLVNANANVNAKSASPAAQTNPAASPVTTTTTTPTTMSAATTAALASGPASGGHTPSSAVPSPDTVGSNDTCDSFSSFTVPSHHHSNQDATTTAVATTTSTTTSNAATHEQFDLGDSWLLAMDTTTDTRAGDTRSHPAPEALLALDAIGMPSDAATAAALGAAASPGVMADLGAIAASGSDMSDWDFNLNLNFDLASDMRHLNSDPLPSRFTDQAQAATGGAVPASLDQDTQCATQGCASLTLNVSPHCSLNRPTAAIRTGELLQYASLGHPPLNSYNLPNHLCVFLLSTSGIILDCNDACLRLFELDRDSFLGGFVGGLNLFMDHNIDLEGRRALIHGNKHTCCSVKRVRRRRSGQVMWVRKTLRRKGMIPESAFGPMTRYAFGMIEPVQPPADGKPYVIDDPSFVIPGPEHPLSEESLIRKAYQSS
ncbi:uncharacterized protein MONBRDRAFT_22099 [Monosiga brevicollis MX1]|uniref:BHLH domain-containing protein n=1 Tax=Monosiga brevicollis TaxID=81824 RepID=A9UPK1_MONBE|nr:uncharacterized protein MONBRDRAFT_22099 [Monosiga brevicollis MX1]EDQ92883.1 predicted protein [Monosiga brevicollis MX1]|eukprot:XP_001742645.1 hypothetical protein [Monosiga brevicollis MX1]